MNYFSAPGVISSEEYTPEMLKIDIANFYGFDPKFMTHSSRKKDFVEARYVAFYWLKMYFGFSLEESGMFLGGRDHATGTHAIRVVDDQYGVSGGFRKKFDGVAEVVKPKIRRLQLRITGAPTVLKNLPYEDGYGNIVNPKK